MSDTHPHGEYSAASSPSQESAVKPSFDLVRLFTSSNGRISRSHYWGSVGLLFLAGAVLGVFTPIAESGLIIVVRLLFTVLYFFIAIKRFHDLGKSGYFALLTLVPIVNILVVVFWLGMIPGTPGQNPYGNEPA